MLWARHSTCISNDTSVSSGISRGFWFLEGSLYDITKRLYKLFQIPCAVRYVFLESSYNATPWDAPTWYDYCHRSFAKGLAPQLTTSPHKPREEKSVISNIIVAQCVTNCRISPPNVRCCCTVLACTYSFFPFVVTNWKDGGKIPLSTKTGSCTSTSAVLNSFYFCFIKVLNLKCAVSGSFEGLCVQTCRRMNQKHMHYGQRSQGSELKWKLKPTKPLISYPLYVYRQGGLGMIHHDVAIWSLAKLNYMHDLSCIRVSELRIFSPNKQERIVCEATEMHFITAVVSDWLFSWYELCGNADNFRLMHVFITRLGLQWGNLQQGRHP